MGWVGIGVGALAAAAGAAYSWYSSGWNNSTKDAIEHINKKIKEGENHNLMKKIMMWGSILSFAGAAIWAVVKFWPSKKGADGRALFNLGFLGETVTPEEMKHPSYLAGRAKKLKEDRKHDLATKSGATMAGLQVESIEASFGKKRYYNPERYGKNNY